MSPRRPVRHKSCGMGRHFFRTERLNFLAPLDSAEIWMDILNGKDSGNEKHSNTMEASVMKVLLVGQTVRSSLRLVQWLEDRGCQCDFAVSCRDACLRVSRMRFDFVLSQFELPDRTAYPLLERLIGSATTLFFSTALENGCLWIPTLARGKRWPASSALRPGEFADTLRRAFDQLKHLQTGMRQDTWCGEFHAQDSPTITPTDQVLAALPQTTPSGLVLQPPR
jgi:PleD family two-component response regulator